MLNCGGGGGTNETRVSCEGLGRNGNERHKETLSAKGTLFSASPGGVCYHRFQHIVTFFFSILAYVQIALCIFLNVSIFVYIAIFACIYV